MTLAARKLEPYYHKAEPFTVKVCEGCQGRRIMPESETVCALCQSPVAKAPRPRLPKVAVPGLKAARQNAEMTQELLSEEVGVARQTINVWESGERDPSEEMAELLADVLFVPLSELTYDGED